MKILTVIKWLGIIIASFATLLVVSLLIISPGKTESFKDDSGVIIEGSVAETVKLKLGGMDQYVIIRGRDTKQPVLLFLHGGPGSPEVSFFSKLYPELEETFIVAHWEQRGSGKSYSKEIPDESMTLDQFVEDAHQLTEYLKERFNRDKIYIMGHSWGSQLGMHVIAKYPEDYHAYLGVSQVVNTRESERISYDWTLEEAKKRDDEKAIKVLQNLEFPSSNDADEWLKYVSTQKKFVTRYGGTTHSNINFIKYFILAKEYTLKEKLYFINSNALYSLRHLWDYLINTNLIEDIPEVDVPVFIFQGVYDYHTPYILAKEYYDNLKAPVKKFYTFENSAHNPHFEEKDKFHDIIINDVLKNSTITPF